MGDLMPVTFEDGLTVYVETTPDASVPGQSRIRAASAPDAAERALDAGARLADSVAQMCVRILGGLKNLDAVDRPDSAEVEFGLSISVEGNVYVVKGSGQGTVKVRAQWQLPSHEQH
jgi:hypothetical protein